MNVYAVILRPTLKLKSGIENLMTTVEILLKKFFVGIFFVDFFL